MTNATQVKSPVYRIGYDNKMFVLVREGGEAVELGEIILTFRDEERKLVGADAPHKPSSTGKVYVTNPDGTSTSQYFPSVFGLVWKEITGTIMFGN